MQYHAEAAQDVIKLSMPVARCRVAPQHDTLPWWRKGTILPGCQATGSISSDRVHDQAMIGHHGKKGNGL
jgi:hypothetical protein